MYKFEIDSSKKVLKITASGMPNREELLNYINDIKMNAKKIDAPNYTLLVDAREQKTLAVDATDLLQDVLKTYLEIPFKNRISILPSSAIADQQIKRVAKDEVTGFIMVRSMEDALSCL